MDYSKFSKINDNKENNLEPLSVKDDLQIDGDINETSNLEFDNDPPKEPKLATVFGCSKLNVREEPSKDGKVLCVIDEGHKLLVEDSLDSWAHMYTESGIEGYVMMEFIKIDIE